MEIYAVTRLLHWLWPHAIASFRPELRKTLQGQIRLQESVWLAETAEQCFGSQVATADSAFHRGRPPSAGPIPRDEEILRDTRLRGTPAVHARFRREGRIDFLDHRGLSQDSYTRCRQDIRQFAKAKVNNLLPGALNQIVRSADHKLDVLAGRIAVMRPTPDRTRLSTIRLSSGIQERLIENPLRGVIEKRQKRLGHHRAVKPQVYSGDRRRPQMAQPFERGVRLRHFSRQHSQEHIVRDGDNARIRADLRSVVEQRSREAMVVHLDFANAATQPNFPAAPFDRIAATLVKLRERYGRDAHSIPFRVPKERFPEHF